MGLPIFPNPCFGPNKPGLCSGCYRGIRAWHGPHCSFGLASGILGPVLYPHQNSCSIHNQNPRSTNLKHDRGLIHHKLRIKHEKRGRRNYIDPMMVSLGFFFHKSHDLLPNLPKQLPTSSLVPKCGQSPLLRALAASSSSLSGLSFKTPNYGLKMG